jgi:DNA-binding response OmpR family regulator
MGVDMRILLAQGDVYVRGFLAASLRSRGFEVVQAADTAEMLVRLCGGPFVAVVMDQALPGIHPLELLPGMRMAWPDTPVILLGQTGDDTCQQAALKSGAHAVLPKPVQLDGLLRTLRAVGSARDLFDSAIAPAESKPPAPTFRNGEQGVRDRRDEGPAGERSGRYREGRERAPTYRG